MQGPIRWLRGEPGLCRDLLGALAGGDGSVRVLRNRPGRRRLLRVRLRPEGGDAADLLVKHIFGAGRRHPHRASLKRWLRLGPAAREWPGLERPWRAGRAGALPRPPAGLAGRRRRAARPRTCGQTTSAGRPQATRPATTGTAGSGWALPGANVADSIASGAPVGPFPGRAPWQAWRMVPPCWPSTFSRAARCGRNSSEAKP